jgi:hypothetical protein
VTELLGRYVAITGYEPGHPLWQSEGEVVGTLEGATDDPIREYLQVRIERPLQLRGHIVAVRPDHVTSTARAGR